MLRARFGEDFVNKLGDRLDVKTTTVDTQKKERNLKKKGGDRKDRPQRQQKDKPEGAQEGAATEAREGDKPR